MTSATDNANDEVVMFVCGKKVEPCHMCGELPSFKAKTDKRGVVRYTFRCSCRSRCSEVLSRAYGKWQNNLYEHEARKKSDEIERLVYGNAPTQKKILNNFHDGRMMA